MSFKFKNTGQDINEIKKRLKNNNNIVDQASIPVGIKTPLQKGSVKGETLFKMHFDIFDQITDNLRNLLMTQKGERLGRPSFGTNLYQIYSQTNVENPDELAIQEISRTVGIFMPKVSLEDFESKIIKNGANEEVIYNIKVYYKVPSLSEKKGCVSLNLKMSN